MNCEEELDIDTLADLLDCDDVDDPSPIPSCSSVQPKLNVQTIAKESTSNGTEALKPKYTSVDLFSLETNMTPAPSGCPESSEVHTGLTDCSDDEEEGNKIFLTETGKTIKKRIAVKSFYETKHPVKKIKTWKDNDKLPNGNASKESYVVDENSGIRIINPLLPHGVMKNKMIGRRMIKMSFMQNYIKKGDIEGDWVTIGIIVNKIPPKTSKNGKTYSIWKMNDLHDVDKVVSLFLFSTVHTEHWKTSVGTVIGILNASILPDRDGNSKTSSISLSVDHPGKLLFIGTSKDFAYCKGHRKDGLACTSIVNKSVCEFCSFHVSKEYKKMSSKRIELQASYSGRGPSLKNKLLKGQNVIYGGQMFAPAAESSSSSKSQQSKDKLKLNSLKFKRKAEEFAEEAMATVTNEQELPRFSCTKSSNSPFSAQSQFIKQQLAIPSVGSRNLALHLSQADRMKEATEKKKKNMTSITPNELLKLHAQQLKDKMKVKANASSLLLRNASPQLGRGLKPGDAINLDVRASGFRQSLTPQDIAKFKVLKKVLEKGAFKPKNPNAVKSVKSPETFAKIQKSLEKDMKPVEDNKLEEKEEVKSLLGTVNINSKKFQEILNRKSSHQFEVEIEEMEKEELYFRNLEKKEQLEQKMISTMEMVCDVVSCKKCRYTAHHASDLCKSENHSIKAHKAIKRFFCCTNCHRRTWAFTKIPKKACRNCGEFSFERTGMMKPRSGPKLDNEILNIRGDEIKFLNSLVH